MTVFEHLASVLATYSKRIEYGFNKDISEFSQSQTFNNTAFCLSWNGENIESHYIDGRIESSMENLTLYYREPAKDRQGATISLTSIYAIRDRIDANNEFTDSVRKTIHINSVIPIISDLQTIVQYELSLY